MDENGRKKYLFHYLDNEKDGKLQFVTKKISRQDIIDVLQFKKPIEEVICNNLKASAKFEEIKLNSRYLFIGLSAALVQRYSLEEIDKYVRNLIYIEKKTSGLVSFKYDNNIYKNDPYLNKEENFLYVFLRHISYSLNECSSENILDLYLTILSSYIDNLEKGKNSNLLTSFKLHFLTLGILDDLIEDEKVKEYTYKNLEKLKDKNLYFVDLSLAEACADPNFRYFSYYEAEKYLLKAFERYGNSSLANSLGYIYYYGRVNNGLIEEEKAFKYFSLGYLTGNDIESAYKLADCYLHGYGVQRNEQAAVNLVCNTLDVVKEWDLERRIDSPISDLFIRIGRFFNEGIYFKKDEKAAFNTFLLGKKYSDERVKINNFFGYKTSNYRLFKDVQELKEKLKIKNTTIRKNNEILLKNMRDLFINLSADEYFEDFINVTNDEVFIKSEGNNLSFVALFDVGIIINLNEVKIKFNGIKRLDDLVELYNKGYIPIIQPGDNFLILTNNEENDYEFFDFDSISISFNNNKKYLTKYRVVDITFKNSTKSYLYRTSRKDIKEKEKAKFVIDSKSQEVFINKIYDVYLDEMPYSLLNETPIN